MYKAKKSLNIANAFSFNKYQSQILNLMGFVILSLMSISSHALAPNRGATCNGIAGASQSSLTNADYTNLVSAVNTDNYVNIAGNASGSIPLQIRMTTSELNGPPTTGSFIVQTIGSNSAFNIVRNFPSVTSVTSIDLDFRNSITEQPIFLTNVAMSAFDIDVVNNTNNSFDDYVLFTGVTANGTTIDGSFQSTVGSNIGAFRETNSNRATFPGLGLFNTSSINANECSGDNLDTACQGSIQFAEPVRSVKVRYSNANYRIFNRNNPTNQQIFFRVDNYCYVPQYIFSGTVFDDNGGITAAQASATNANFNSGTYNNTNYFNGVFNPPQETGISGSTVKLASCDSNNPLTYATQTVNSSGATIGEFQFSVPLSTFGTNRSICLIESRTGATYPIRTTIDNINTGFATTTYNYPNRNFGRVIAENAALVLRKAQYVNNCPSTIPYTDPDLNRVGETDLRNGFSESANNGNALTPGQCIAYRITATNRANVPITNFVMQDKLQSKSDGAAVTSTLANPVASTTDYASNSVAIGNNGTVITNSFTLNARSNRNFYFNTKYGTTVNAQ
ncbi:hypothetical protein NJD71_01890 [Psychrobacter sp. PP-21]|uniref:hypothetical protein n=1 Tax=Psychrobacter sp. PP-21 TaxID=2957503 RepID=UPI0029A37AA2|nr:hypothetical protein [Psychrobacter sp. PP-21]MDX2372873.1 hypothetical protein [Psychrobacter sp. PP-21]